MARDPYNVFRMQQQFFFILKNWPRGQKSSHVYFLCVDFPGSLQHFNYKQISNTSKIIFPTERTRQKWSFLRFLEKSWNARSRITFVFCLLVSKSSHLRLAKFTKFLLSLTTAPVPPQIHTQAEIGILADVIILVTGFGRFRTVFVYFADICTFLVV